ncbi:MAG TPA: RsmD family RNA methyltransferase [Longimicrobiales bacterium]|nr:RsmD family RNA methyltransferase [Longimicrobiales bacterium]
MRIIAGEWRGRRLSPLRGRDVRPTSDRVREAWMSAMGGHFAGWRVLDLFAGSGALGLECLSRGAAHATFVDKAGSSLAVLRRNVALLGAQDRATLVQADVLAWLARDPKETATRPDVALADPPYGQGLAARVFERFLEAPFANALWVEHATGEVLPPAPGLRQRRYGDTTISHLDAPS